MIYLELGRQIATEAMHNLRTSLRTSEMADDLYHRLLLADSNDFYGMKLDMLQTQKLEAEYTGLDWGKVVSKATNIAYRKNLRISPAEAEIAYAIYESYHSDPQTWADIAFSLNDLYLQAKMDGIEIDEMKISTVFGFLENFENTR